MQIFDDPEEKKKFENIVENGENAGGQHFVLFPHCFYHMKGRFHILNNMEFVIVNAFNLDRAENILSDKEFIEWQSKAPPVIIPYT